MAMPTSDAAVYIPLYFAASAFAAFRV